MRSLLYVLTAVGVMGLVFWAYRQNYATHSTLREVRQLQSQIADLKQSLSAQRAEWAYLNRPDRLRELALLNFKKLHLLPMLPEQFATVSDIPFPPKNQAVSALSQVTDAQRTSGERSAQK